MELIPWQDRANVHEPSKVEQDVDTRVDFVMARFGLFEILAIPVECASGDEACEKVVSTEGAACANDKQLNVH